MANLGFGLRLVDQIGGRRPQIREYYIPSSNGTALFQGDVVKLVAAMDPTGQVSEITQAATGDVLLGVVVGFKPSPALPYTGSYNPASTGRYVLVCDDPEAIYEVQEDGVGNVVTQANIAKMVNIAMVVAAGSTVTGLSGIMADSSVTSNSAAEDLKIVGVRRDPTNVGATAVTGAVLLVKVLSAAVNATQSL